MNRGVLILLLKLIYCFSRCLKPLWLRSLITLELALLQMRMKYYYYPVNRYSVSLSVVGVSLLLTKIYVS